MQFIRQNDTGKIGVGPFVDVGDGATMETIVTLSGADEASCRLGDDTVVDIGAYTWAAITGMDGYYDLTLQTGVTDTCGPMILNVEDVSLCLPVRMDYMIIEEAVYDDLFATSAAGYAGVTELANITGTSGVLIGTDAANVTEISDAVWDEDATGHQTQGTFGQAIGDPAADATTIYQAVATDAAGDNVAIDVVAVKAETALIVADTNELQTDDVPGLIATAQADLDTITGTAGVLIGTDAANVTEISDAVWDEAQSGHTGAGTFGEVATEVASILVDTGEIGTAGAGLTNLGASGNDWNTVVPPTAQEIEDEVWNAATSAHVTAGSMAIPLTTDIPAILVDTADIQPNYATEAKQDIIDTNVDNLNLGIIYGAAVTGTLTTAVCTSDLMGYVDDELVGRVIIFTGGQADGQASDITDYASASGTVTYTAITTAPLNLDTFKIV